MFDSWMNELKNKSMRGRDAWFWELGRLGAPWDNCNRQGGFPTAGSEIIHRASKSTVERECLLSQSREKTSPCPLNELRDPWNCHPSSLRAVCSVITCWMRLALPQESTWLHCGFSTRDGKNHLRESDLAIVYFRRERNFPFFYVFSFLLTFDLGFQLHVVATKTIAITTANFFRDSTVPGAYVCHFI